MSVVFLYELRFYLEIFPSNIFPYFPLDNLPIMTRYFTGYCTYRMYLNFVIKFPTLGHNVLNSHMIEYKGHTQDNKLMVTKISWVLKSPKWLHTKKIQTPIFPLGGCSDGAGFWTEAFAFGSESFRSRWRRVERHMVNLKLGVKIDTDGLARQPPHLSIILKGWDVSGEHPQFFILRRCQSNGITRRLFSGV